MEFHMINMTYAALHMRAKTEKIKHFHAKMTVHWRSTHGAGHIPLCGIFNYMFGTQNVSMGQKDFTITSQETNHMDSFIPLTHHLIKKIVYNSMLTASWFHIYKIQDFQCFIFCLCKSYKSTFWETISYLKYYIQNTGYRVDNNNTTGGRIQKTG